MLGVTLLQPRYNTWKEESFDGTIYSNTRNFPEVGWSIGVETGFGIAIHASASISYTGMYENFISFGRRRQWWK